MEIFCHGPAADCKAIQQERTDICATMKHVEEVIKELERQQRLEDVKEALHICEEMVRADIAIERGSFAAKSSQLFGMNALTELKRLLDIVKNGVSVVPHRS